MTKIDPLLKFSLFSINIGIPKKVAYGSSSFMVSAIKKKSVSGAIFLRNEGLEGDGWADLRFHGGVDKSVCAYSKQHYCYWEQELSKSLLPGAFGENFTLTNVDETTIFLGDIYRSGDVEIQVSQPRIPCHKLNKVFGRKKTKNNLSISNIEKWHTKKEQVAQEMEESQKANDWE